MVVFINPITGTEMLVADSRADEYKAAGFKLAAEVGTKEPDKEETVEKKTTKKATTKRK